MKKAYFTAPLRTPFTRAAKGSYKDTRPDDLLVELINAQKKKNPDFFKKAPEDIITGCAYPEGPQGYNVSRMAALGAGLSSSAMTVNRLCASSLEAVSIAAARINSGCGDFYLCAGVESMSKVPRGGHSYSESDKIKEVSHEAYIGMGFTAENVFKKYPHISRLAQEDFAQRSHELSDKAWEEGKYDDFIFPYLAEKDEFIRTPVNREKMASLPGAFLEGGNITAATSSPLTDGATSGWVVSEDEIKNLPLKDGLEILHTSWGHVAPEVMGLGPVTATKKLFQKTGIKASELSAVEINEAFAIQVLASLEELEIKEEIVNTWGGALALGHPLGASGLRLVMTLLGRLREQGEDGALGLATLCVGGGQGMSVLVKYTEF